MANKHRGNIAELRKRRSRIIDKKASLANQIKNETKYLNKTRLQNKLNKLRTELGGIIVEIEKHQKGMQNSNKWMSGDYKNLREI